MSHTNTTITTNAYFDLKSYIGSIQCPDVAAQCAQSAAFALDINIQTSVRALMKTLREQHELHGIDTIDDMTIAMRERGFTETLMQSAGKDDLGPIATIVQLSRLREEWHQLAADLTGLTFDWKGVPRTYEIHDMEEILNREVKLGVRPDTERKIRLTVQRRADDASKDDIERVVERRLQREAQRARDTSMKLMDQRETLVTLYRIVVEDAAAGAYDNLVSEDASFHALDVSLQRSMIEGAMRGAERAEDFATQSSSITDAEFDAVSFAVIRVERELKAVLQSPKFVVQQRKADAGRSVSA